MLSTLSELKKVFLEFIQEIGIETIEFKEEKMEKFKNKGLSEGIWAQLLFTIKFWLEDNSAGFEKTDVLIEKSVNTVVDLLDTKPLESLFDLGKFLWKEKFKGKKLSDTEIIATMVAHPKLIERPIVVKNDKAAIGRPIENVLKIL